MFGKDLGGLDSLFGGDFFDQLLGQQPTNAQGQACCAGCRADVRDLRTWPPQATTGLLFCAGCRVQKALHPAPQAQPQQRTSK